MKSIFVDTDIIMDLLSYREPFYKSAAKLFSDADKGKLEISISALTIANLNYVLSRQFSVNVARKQLLKFKTLVKVLPINDKIIDLALSSEFKDFEDAIQYYTATEHGISILLTRNLKDYKKAQISIMTAEQFSKL